MIWLKLNNFVQKLYQPSHDSGKAAGNSFVERYSISRHWKSSDAVESRENFRRKDIFIELVF